MQFKKINTNRGNPSQGNGYPDKDKSHVDVLGIQMQSFNYVNDFQVLKHDELLRQLESTVAKKVKDCRRYPVEVVQANISNLCQKTLHIIQGDLEPIRIQVKHGKGQFERKLADFNKEELTERQQKKHFRQTSHEILQSLKGDLTKNVKKLMAKRHVVLEKLKQKKYELEDTINEKYQGQTPERQWYNN